MHTPQSRRAFLKGAATAGAVAAGPFIITRPGWAQTGPIRIGILEPQSGPVKYVGDTYIAGVRFGAEQVNRQGGILGRQLEIVVADSELKPDVATRRANDLLLAEKVDLLGVGTGSNIAKAVSQLARQHRKLFVSYGSRTAPRRPS